MAAINPKRFAKATKKVPKRFKRAIRQSVADIPPKKKRKK